MSAPYSTLSTNSPGTTSVGLFVPSYERRLSLRTLSEPWMQFRTGTRASFYGTIGDPGQELTFETHAFDEDALRRVVSCFIIANLPAEGAQEAFEALRGMLDFYSSRVLYAPAAPPQMSVLVWCLASTDLIRGVLQGG